MVVKNVPELDTKVCILALSYFNHVTVGKVMAWVPLFFVLKTEITTELTSGSYTAITWASMRKHSEWCGHVACGLSTLSFIFVKMLTIITGRQPAAVRNASLNHFDKKKRE